MELRLVNISKRYGEKVALKGFSAVLTEGIYGMLGPNGAGKSTLLLLLTDNVKRDGGDILLDGTEIKALGGEYRRLLGYMPQVQGMYDDFSAREFLLYMAGIKGLRKREAKDQVEELLRMLSLASDAHRKVGGFSGGMRQRVLLGQALLGDPKILILDEPTAGLDPEERIRIRNHISKLSKDRIVILATHIVSDIESIAKKVFLLRQGELVADGTPMELIRSVEGKVAERICGEEELSELTSRFAIGNVAYREGGLVVRVVGDALPEGFTVIKGAGSLEDVYLYYLEGARHRNE